MSWPLDAKKNHYIMTTATTAAAAATTATKATILNHIVHIPFPPNSAKVKVSNKSPLSTRVVAVVVVAAVVVAWDDEEDKNAKQMSSFPLYGNGDVVKVYELASKPSSEVHKFVSICFEEQVTYLD